MRDPYEVLGVQRSASAAELKSAYRRLAKKLHPDANKHDPKAATRFAELNAAYEILGDAEKRKAFDRGEIDAEGKPRFRGFEGFGGADREGAFETFSWGPGGFQRAGRGAGGAGGPGGAGFGGIEDILKDVFGGAARARRGGAGFQFEAEDFGAGAGRDVTVPLTISLDEAAKGGTRRVQLPTGKSVEVKIPAGRASGQQIRLKGQGFAGPGGAAGDALITVTRCWGRRCASRLWPARSSWRCRRAPAAAAPSACAARVCRRRTGVAICSSPCASCCPSVPIRSSSGSCASGARTLLTIRGAI
jgi:DnaJ-class molecular chaperone